MVMIPVMPKSGWVLLTVKGYDAALKIAVTRSSTAKHSICVVGCMVDANWW